MRARWNPRTILCHALLNILLFGALVLLYAINEYDNVTLDEIIYHAKHPIAGIEFGIIAAFVCYTLVPVFIFNIIYIFITKNKKILLSFVTIIAIAAIYLYSAVRFDIISYNKYSNFIESNYVNPGNVLINFREKKNLVYIYLESMETSFADKKNGGIFEENLIPNLTRLAHDHINFSGNTGKLNGAYSLPGTTWTMGAVFALSTGLPLKIAVDANDMESQDAFFPGIVSLGDILRENGYVQEVLLGSKSTFAGQKMFFQQHGGFKVLDYDSMTEEKIIPEGYKVFWGVEDHKLIEIAKSELEKLSKTGKPFHFSMFTMDTHAPNGYLGDTCENRFADMQYKNVIYCSDNQITHFINWIQQQEFYKNTVIVLAGDHPTMKKYFIETGKKYTRKNYTVYINVQEHADPFRAYSSFDQFPTVLSAIGADIPGERLGLGVNLFSKERTLVERYGYDALAQELKKRSKFMEGTKIAFPFSKISTNRQLHGSAISFSKAGNDNIDLSVDLSDFQWGKTFNEMMTISKPDDIIGIYADFYTDDDLYKKRRMQLTRHGDHLFSGKLKSLKSTSLYHIKIYIQGPDYRGNPYSWITGEIVGNPRLYAANFHDYLKMLGKKQYAIFISAKNDAENAIPDSIIKSLQELGLHADRENKCSYCAVLEGGNIHEEASEQALETNASLSGNPDVHYSIKSAGSGSESLSSIRINGREYSKNLPGLNIVVYDNQLKQVIDSACFDTRSGKMIR